jgi:hypothetical protein
MARGMAIVRFSVSIRASPRSSAKVSFRVWVMFRVRVVLQ